MQIKDIFSEEKFKDLQLGEICRYDENLYMRILEVVRGEDFLNCVCLENGFLSFIPYEELVVPVDGYFQVTSC